MKEIKLYKSPIKSLRLLFLSSIFVITSAWIIMTESKPDNSFWFCLCFFGIGFLLSLYNILDGRAQIIITKLEEFRDLNGGVWDTYREELNKSIGIIKGTSERLGNDLDNINAEFYERLNDTFTNLDLLIQRFIPSGQK